MRGLLSVLALLVGCQFEHGSAPRDGATIGPDVDDSAAPRPDTTNAPFCDPNDPDLVACYAFDGTTQDATTNALNATMTNVTFVAGKVGMAVHVDATSAMDVAENAALDIPYHTLEAWVRPSVIPTVRAGVLDCQAQYSLFLYPNGDVRCDQFQIVANVQPNVWTHLGCTYDGAIHIYIDGAERGTSPGGGLPLSTLGTTGYSLGADNPPGSGANLEGEIDQLRVFKAPRTPEQMCADAGRTSCP